MILKCSIHIQRWYVTCSILRAILTSPQKNHHSTKRFKHFINGAPYQIKPPNIIPSKTRNFYALDLDFVLQQTNQGCHTFVSLAFINSNSIPNN